MQVKTMVLAAALSVPGLLHAQFDFKLDGKPVQIHSFASQGFAYSNDNNYLTMNSSDGSFAMTDAGANISMSITDRFRVGAQVYLRNLGQLDKYRPQLDWAYGSYKLTDWFGVRAGKIKTALGLFNDTQDMGFLHTWVLLPQSVYPADLRSNSIAHTGADAYGTVGLHKAGSLSYTAYFGAQANDTRGGYYYGTASVGTPITSFAGKTGGADLRWNTPVSGLMLGGSWSDETLETHGTAVAYGNAPFTAVNQPAHLTSVYGDYARGRWHLEGEFRKTRDLENASVLGQTVIYNFGSKGLFLTAAFRVNKRLELGTYHSRYYVDAPTDPTNHASNHIFDQAVTARFDITRWWYGKIEGHFIDGYGDMYSFHGFYGIDNPAGLKPTTLMLVLQTGFDF